MTSKEDMEFKQSLELDGNRYLAQDREKKKGREKDLFLIACQQKAVFSRVMGTGRHWCGFKCPSVKGMSMFSALLYRSAQRGIRVL